MSLFRKLLINVASSEKDSFFTVTYTSEGKEIGQVMVKSGERVSEPVEPQRVDYTFKGWMLNGETYDFNTKVTGNIELVAGWTITVYTQNGTATVQLLLYRPVNTGLYFAFYGVTVVFEKPFREILSCECHGEAVENKTVMNALQLYFNNTGFRHMTGQEARMNPDKPSVMTGILTGTVSWKASGYF